MIKLSSVTLDELYSNGEAKVRYWSGNATVMERGQKRWE